MPSPDESRIHINDVAYQLANLFTRATMNGTMAQPTHKTAAGLWSSSSVVAANILAAKQRSQIQILCACMACVSITATLCAIYWFCMMRRNYRRDLILMLILGDFYKSMWYLIHGSVNFARSQVQSRETFCQVSGFMLQVGLQACGKFICFLIQGMLY